MIETVSTVSAHPHTKPLATWTVVAPKRASIRAIIAQFAHAIGHEPPPPVPPTAPLALHVTYHLRGGRWLPVGDVALDADQAPRRTYHLSAPGAPAVAVRFADALARVGVVKPGQIVSATALKLPAGLHENRAEVALNRMYDADTQLDHDARHMRYLRWYLDMCDRNSLKPHYAVYKAMIARLRDTTKENSDLNPEHPGIAEAFIAAVEKLG